MKPVTEVAKEIRKELKQRFPGVKFSVRSSRSGSITVSWSDFPTQERVEAVTGKYEEISRCEVTGEILSGGNLFVSASNEWTEGVRAEIESEMPEGIQRGDFEYWPAFHQVAERIYQERYRDQIEQSKHKKEKSYREIKNPEDPATYRQKMALIKILGVDGLTKEQASELIQKGRDGMDILPELERILKNETARRVPPTSRKKKRATDSIPHLQLLDESSTIVH
ncbi:LPD29 domain-containing protein [Kroppenstedtia sanguinis]|uniref:LPD29 domain-containing protein n=1 Tax=Kroppenstedtia sanguinis TaxID=1380684 RepID=A0ABW4CDU3_9BACL